MIDKHILITGGAGFIGSHLADHLLSKGYRIRVLDNLDPQVHGSCAQRPQYLDPEIELVTGDVRDRDAVTKALRDVDAVYHFASAVGVGQSMYDIARYTDINNVGTAVLLEALTANPVERLIVASSMSLYGEGLYQDSLGNVVPGHYRSSEQLRMSDWELKDEMGEPMKPLPTPETKPSAIASVYALSKFDQEQMCLMVGKAYGFSAVALRFFNAYGSRQALSNPYTGVMAIFASRLLNDKPPMVFEDGQQLRDFVSVHDIAEACILALEVDKADGKVFNIGSGRPLTINQVAQSIAAALGKAHIPPQITGKSRVGDIRHCFADITLAGEILGYKPDVGIEQGIPDLACWLQEQTAVDRVDDARAELTVRGLVV